MGISDNSENWASSCACFLSFTPFIVPTTHTHTHEHIHLYTHLLSSPKLLYPEPSCSARAGPFHSLLSMPLTPERTGSAPLRGLAHSRTLDVDIVGAAGPPHPGNQAPLSPYPSLFAQPLFPPRPTLLLFSPSPWDWKKAWETAWCFVLTAWLCCWWPGFLWCTKADVPLWQPLCGDQIWGSSIFLVTQKAEMQVLDSWWEV